MNKLDHVPLDNGCQITLFRTLRVPDDGGSYPLPPGLGTMDSYLVEENRYFVPMHHSEAVWMSFEASGLPHALKIATGKTDAVSGEAFEADTLKAEPQDYVVIDDQPWLDGFKVADGVVRQFVATPLHQGTTVESQLSDAPEEGGLTFALFPPKPGRIEATRSAGGLQMGGLRIHSAAELGLGAGGRIEQEIYEDGYGVDTWEPEPSVTVEVNLIDALAFTALTGIPVPEPADAATYTEHGFPWFDLLAPTKQDIATTDRLAKIKSIGDITASHDGPLPIPENQIISLLNLRDRLTR